MCLYIIFATIVFILLALLLYFWVTSDASQANSKTTNLEEWARENGYKLISQSETTNCEGPIVWTARMGISGRSIKQIRVYRISVEDQEKNIKQGWIRVSFWTFNPSSANIEVLWDSDKPTLYTDGTPVAWINLVTNIVVVVIFVLFIIFTHPTKLVLFLAGWLLCGIIFLVKKFTT